MRRRALPAIVILGVTAATSSALADDSCDLRSPQGITSRTLYPPAGTVAVPVNTVVTVRYKVGSPSWPATPELGSDLVLRPVGGAEPVKVVRQVLPPGSSILETAVMLKPLASLLPSTIYEVLDRRTVPCPTGGMDAGSLVACDPGVLAVFATFTTGTAMDTVAPQFAGASSLTVLPFSQCTNYVSRPFDVGWAKAQDDVAGEAVLYHLYQFGEDRPLASYVSGTTALLAVGCNSGQVLPRFIRATYSMNYTGSNETGSFYVRAVDWAGNEDANKVPVTIKDPCDGAPPADGGVNGPTTDAGQEEFDARDAAEDVAVVQEVLPATDGAAVDAAASIDAAAGVDASVAVDARTPTPNSDDDGCSVGPGDAGSSAGVGIFAMGLLLLALARRRRP